MWLSDVSTYYLNLMDVDVRGATIKSHIRFHCVYESFWVNVKVYVWPPCKKKTVANYIYYSKHGKFHKLISTFAFHNIYYVNFENAVGGLLQYSLLIKENCSVLQYLKYHSVVSNGCYIVFYFVTVLSRVSIFAVFHGID